MNLNTFHIQIDSKILARGNSYYYSDSVEDLQQVEKNEFCATVQGSEAYNVFVKIDGDLDILEHSCDCPYDWGNVCKHEVAVFYYLKEHQPFKQPVGQSKFQQAKTDLHKMDKRELVELIIELCKRNGMIREEVFWELGYESE